ncbi:MAG: hypothetical protein PUD16_09355 [bacterium]|nr:hypothetical protein [bacterium]
MKDVFRRSSARADHIGWAVFILSPFLLLWMISLFLGVNTLDSHPVWMDELSNYRTLLSWHEHGFSTGYYGMLEQNAAIGTMGTSGIGPILIYGLFVKLFGVSHNTIMLCNALWCSLAAAVFCLIRKPRLSASLLLTGLMLCYAPIVLYCLTSMTQWFDYALVLLYITFLLGFQEKRRVWMLVLCILCILMGTLYRPMYCILFLPVILIFCRYRIGWRLVWFSIPALIASFICCYIGMQTAAPQAQGFVYHLLRAPDAATFVRMLLSHAKSNLMDYFIRPTHSLMQDAFRVLYWGVTIGCGLGTFVCTVLSPERKLRLRFGYRGPMMSCFALLLAAFAFTVLFYETYDWQDFRRLAPYLWLVIAYMVARNRPSIPTLMLGCCVVTLGLLLFSPEGAFVDANRFAYPESPESLPEVVAAIEYDEAADDPFDNTIRTDLCTYPIMEQIHPGMGMQYGWFTTETTGKSRWILTDRLKCPVSGYENVLDTGDYKLYRKIDE